MKRLLTIVLVTLSIGALLMVSIAACSSPGATRSTSGTVPPPSQRQASVPQPAPSAQPRPAGEESGFDWMYTTGQQPVTSDAAVGFDPELQRSLSLDQSLRSTPGTMPALDEELWVVQLPEDWKPQPDPLTPGTGSLMCTWAGGDIDNVERLVPVPLASTDVSARIGGIIASTVVTQSFQNPYSEKIEAVYVFPLPQNAAVNEFIMVVGERRIRGIIREKQEAERIYNQARAQGHVASLLTQQRPNIFTQKVANIEPGRAIDIEITYLHTLPYRDGSLEYIFPMVVGPRFNPPTVGAGGIGAVPRTASSNQQTNVSYLAPRERSGHDIGIDIAIDAGVPIRGIHSKHHTVQTHRTGEHGAHVRLTSRDTLPNKDFVLQLDIGGSMTTSGVLTWDDGRGGGYFAAMLVPPAELASLPRRAMELVFVLDCSGSMSGTPIEQAKAAIRKGLDLLEPSDTFQVIRFSNNASGLGDQPLAANRDNLRRARRYVDGLHGSGGTMMIEGIRAALGYQHAEGRQRYVVFLTDGYIGNEAEILSEMARSMGASRVFSMGVGSSPNRYLMERMAKLGRGAVAYLSPRDDARETMTRFFETVSRPAMTEVTLDLDTGAGTEVTEVYPSSAQDLFVGRPVVITGRYAGRAPSSARLRGHAAGEVLDMSIAARPVSDTTLGAGLRTVWARGKIADLMDLSLTVAMPDLAHRIEQLALEHSLMSAFTAFVAVDSSRITEGSHGTTVAVPVPVPEGVRYETTVGAGGAGGAGGGG